MYPLSKQEEIRQLELAGDFEAGARLRQQLRDVRRAERKAAEVAAEQAEADVAQEKADRLFNKNARREQMADLKRVGSLCELGKKFQLEL